MSGPALRLTLDPDELPAVRRPTLLVDRMRAERNLDRMLARARAAGARLRPHVKTHRSRAVGRWLQARRIDAIATSSLEMAAYFAADGWRDILVAIPCNLRELDLAAVLARDLQLGLTVDSEEAVAAVSGLAGPADLWIEIDTGYGRTGVAAGDPERVLALAGRIAAAGPRLRLAGLLAHEGRTYRAATPQEIGRLHAEAMATLGGLRRRLRQAGHACAISIGDTPACSLAPDLSGADELRPGNFLFYDLMQARLGACSEEDVACALACPIIGRYPERGEIVVHGGAVHLSREFLPELRPAGRSAGEPCFGRLARWDGRGWLGAEPAAPVVALSQEHGTVRLPAAALAGARIGGLALILPVHSCLTADLHGRYLDLEGNELDAMGR